MNVPFLPTRVGLRCGPRTFPVVPLALSGEAASVTTADLPCDEEPVRIVLAWAGGGVTELEASVRDWERSRRVVNLDVRAVLGDWQPFLRYLGEHTN